MTYLNLRLVYGCLANAFAGDLSHKLVEILNTSQQHWHRTKKQLLTVIFFEDNKRHFLLLLLSGVDIDIHKCCITATCWTLPRPPSVPSLPSYIESAKPPICRIFWLADFTLDDENEEGCSYSVCLWDNQDNQDNPALWCDRKVTQQNKNTTQSPWMCREAAAPITERSSPEDEEANTLNLRSSDPSLLQCYNY